MTKMLALAIFGAIFAIYMLTTLVVVIIYNSLTMATTPDWFEKVYEVLTFQWR